MVLFCFVGNLFGVVVVVVIIFVDCFGWLEFFVQFGFQVLGNLWVVVQVIMGVVFVLIDVFFIVVVLGIGFFDQFGFYVYVDQFVFVVDVFVIEDFGDDLFEWWCQFVFDDFDFGLVVDDFVVFFDGVDMMDVQVY